MQIWQLSTIGIATRVPALIVASLASIAAFIALPAQAALVQYTYTATVSNIAETPGGTDTVNWLTSSSIAGPTISIGDTWTGTVFYDTDLALTTYQPSPEQGTYQMWTGNIGSTITDTRSGLSFSSDPKLNWRSLLAVRDSSSGVGADYLSLTAYRSGTDFETGRFWFTDVTGNALSSSAPPASLSLDDYPFATASYSFLQSGTLNWMNAEANITSLTLVTAPVPEPSTYMMLGLGLAALAFVSTKQRRA